MWHGSGWRLSKLHTWRTRAQGNMACPCWTRLSTSSTGHSCRRGSTYRMGIRILRPAVWRRRVRVLHRCRSHKNVRGWVSDTPVRRRRCGGVGKRRRRIRMEKGDRRFVRGAHDAQHSCSVAVERHNDPVILPHQNRVVVPRRLNCCSPARSPNRMASLLSGM